MDIGRVDHAVTDRIATIQGGVKVRLQHPSPMLLCQLGLRSVRCHDPHAVIRETGQDSHFYSRHWPPSPFKSCTASVRIGWRVWILIVSPGRGPASEVPMRQPRAG